MTEELKQKAENFIIDRYKIAECYREDNAETREYMRNDVHSQYEEEYQLYIAGAIEATKELQEQIEKMKCCGNCKYCGTPCTHPSRVECEELDKWELAE